MTDLIVLFEHPEWQLPLFSALERRGISFVAFDLKRGAFDTDRVPAAKLVFNQASPSAYNRGHDRAVPLAQALIRAFELHGVPVLNGSRALSLELSKSAQGALCRSLGIEHPRSVAFNDVEAVLAQWTQWPALLKPEQGGSGARMYEVQSPDELRRLFDETPELWRPDNLMLLQVKFAVDPNRGIVRMEFLGGELLYAMRVVSHGSFNLCPSEVCNPADRTAAAAPAVEFYPYPEVPVEAVAQGKKLVEAGGLDVGGIEYLEAPDGRLIFFDINANSNLRPAIAAHFGFDPFDRVVDFLEKRIA